MTPGEMAAIHSRAVDDPARWSAVDFADILATPGAILVLEDTGKGFALGRVIADQAELLMLAIDPIYQRRGLGQTCLAGFEEKAQALGVARCFLEVAATNEAALALYSAAGWTEDGVRKGYYRRQAGKIDAVLMSKGLLPG